MSERIFVDLDEEGASRDARERKEAVEIDMNPMVDLAFLLLTFFMLTTTFARPQTMELLMPAKPKPGAAETEQPVKESKTLSIVLGEQNQLYWYRGITDPDVQSSSYGAEGIRKVLMDTKAEVRGLVVMIKPLKASQYKNLVDILDEMNTSEIQRYAIVPISPEEEAMIAEVQP